MLYGQGAGRCARAISKIPGKAACLEWFTCWEGSSIFELVRQRFTGRQLGDRIIQVGLIVPYVNGNKSRITNVAGGGVDGNQAYPVVAYCSKGVANINISRFC